MVIQQAFGSTVVAQGTVSVWPTNLDLQRSAYTPLYPQTPKSTISTHQSPNCRASHRARSGIWASASRRFRVGWMIPFRISTTMPRSAARPAFRAASHSAPSSLGTNGGIRSSSSRSRSFFAAGKGSNISGRKRVSSSTRTVQDNSSSAVCVRTTPPSTAPAPVFASMYQWIAIFNGYCQSESSQRWIKPSHAATPSDAGRVGNHDPPDRWAATRQDATCSQTSRPAHNP
jgi:hypothetical protein